MMNQLQERNSSAANRSKPVPRTDQAFEGLEKCEACGGDGVLFVSVDGLEAPKDMKFIQRCDLCERYEDDYEAAANAGRPILAILVREV